MSTSFKKSDKELLDARNAIFKEYGIPGLERNGYVKSPFKSSWFGQYDTNIRGYSYELCRLADNGELHLVNATMVKGDKWIKINLNIFQLGEKLESLDQLGDCEGINFHLPPHDSTSMRLRNDDYKGPPLFHMMFSPEYKLGNVGSESSFEKEVRKLADLVGKDMANIRSFERRWHELHRPRTTDVEGNVI
ncbi:hypothetical protein HYN56_19835 [Flavobacterium crocinum]|uniref:Uncharacterized protein n=1 Tax=Flavobacterium crocinum TaxID=2183896 RepID=A0A2S1YQJ8_9FLAO|nr:hypothetical protein [Flavobacterium crocinum]AWK06355.1 hypothetical protein HYN56_19835 [Flavobacterium crocinum]